MNNTKEELGTERLDIICSIVIARLSSTLLA